MHRKCGSVRVIRYGGLHYQRMLRSFHVGECVRGRVHVDRCGNRVILLRPWLSKHGEISKDNLETYIEAFKTYRRQETSR